MPNELQHTVIAPAIPPAVIKDDAAFSSLVLDRNDFPGMKYGEFHINIGAIDATMAALKVMESDTKTNSTTLGGTPATVKDVTTKPGSSDSNKVAVIGVDFSNSRERYFQLQGTAGDGASGTYLSATFVGSRVMNSSDLAADRNCLFAEYG